MFSENLFFTAAPARALYEKYAKELPIIDYHCHLSPKEIYEDRRFSDLGEIWLAHDHYKWRAMRAFGIDEELITGGASFYDKFCAFASILPQLAGNPLYIWCALELKRYFGVDEPLSEKNAKAMYDRTSALIAERNMTPSYFIRQSNVEFIATTDDPADDLAYHRKIAEAGGVGVASGTSAEGEVGAASGVGVASGAGPADRSGRERARCRVVPAFRPDKALNIEKPGFADYVGALSEAAGMPIGSFRELLAALERRLLYFKEAGSMINDNAVTRFIWTDYTDEEIERVFQKALADSRPGPGSGRAVGARLTEAELNAYRSAFLFEMSRLYAKHGFVTQYHIGAYRDANAKMFARLGPDSGYDCVDEAASVRSFGTLLDRLNSAGELPKIIFYPLDINQYEAFAVLATAFCGGGRGKVQLGAPWWFNDQLYGITKQFESVGSLYPVALSVGMLTDSRSFLSYPRHELYRRALCNYLGTLVERGEYFSGEQELGAIIRAVCYENAKSYFGL
ncbi:MAG: glucuronate isomerase [Clostridiales bacterium]|jgi:glucuronate isomerase|nr:glucuronate isomerase [Clostridiales bacterium]